MNYINGLLLVERFFALKRLIGFSVYCYIAFLSIPFSKVKITPPPKNNMITINKNNVLIWSKTSSLNIILTRFSGFSTKFAGRINTRIIKIIDPTKKIEYLFSLFLKILYHFTTIGSVCNHFGITLIYP